MHKISVVIPAFNAQSRITELIKTLGRNNASFSEIIVVDDGSTDKTDDEAKKAGAKVITNSEPKGPAGARNCGAMSSKSPWILFCDTDVIPPPGIVDDMLRLAEATPEAAGVSTFSDTEPINKGFIPHFRALYEDNWSKKAENKGKYPVLTTRFGVVKKEVLENLGYFPVQYRNASIEDYAFYQKAEKAGVYFVVLHGKKVRHVWSNSFAAYISNLARKSIPFFRYKLSNPGFDTVHSTGQIGLSLFAGLLSVIFLSLSGLNLSFLLPALLMALVFSIGYKELLGELFKSRGTGFTIKSWLLLFIQPPLLFLFGLYATGSHLAQKTGFSDAFAYLRAVVSSGLPAYGIFFVTSKCNANCGFCFYNGNWPKGNSDIPYTRWVKIAKSFRGSLFHANITGGEPTLSGDLFKICEAFTFYSKAKVISINTNGSKPDALEKTVVKLCEAYPALWVRVNFSVDGIGEEHDESRKLKGLYALLQESYTRQAAHRKNYPRLSIQGKTVIGEHNKDRASQIIASIRNEFAFDAHDIGFVRGEPSDPDTRFVSKKMVRDILANVASINTPGKGISGWVTRSIGRQVNHLMTFGFSRKEGYCMAGEKSVVIDHDGKVLACEGTVNELGKRFDGQAILGNLKQYSDDLKLLLSSPRARQTVSRLKKNDCNCTHECAFYVRTAFTLKGLIFALKNN